MEVGVDEAGRGCLAGPVFAAAVIWPPLGGETEARLRADPRLKLVRDSKTLSPAQRVQARAFIEAEAVAWGVGTADVEEIDRDNILKATMRAMRRALDGALVSASEKSQASQASQALLLIDGERFEGYISPVPPHDFLQHTCVVEGDGKYLSIAAASVLAKTHRDEYVVATMHPRHPAYAWDRNKGYGTAAHIDALRAQGACVEHRTKFVATALAPKAAKAPKAPKDERVAWMPPTSMNESLDTPHSDPNQLPTSSG